MAFSLIPRGVYASFAQLKPEALKEKGIRLVLADLDNTLASYRVAEPSEELLAWKRALDDQGIRLFILSNSRKSWRVGPFAKALGVPYQGHSGKPKKTGFFRALERMGCRPEEAVMIGDQIFTDTLGASRAGIVPLLVLPIRLSGNPGRYVRYGIETPFRLLGKRRPFL